MIMKERAIDAGTIGGTVLLIVAAWWTAGLMRGREQLRATSQPRPTVTVTQPAPAATPSAPPGRSTAPSSPPPAAAGVLAAGESPEPTGAGDDGRTVGSSGSGTQPRPSPTAAPRPPSTGSSLAGVKASVRLPLGVLPRIGADLSIGGTKR